MRNSVWERIYHRNDDIKYTGYNYYGNILKKSLSNVFFNENKRKNILEKIDIVLSELVDHVKMIKKTYNWVVSKNYKKIN